LKLIVVVDYKFVIWLGHHSKRTKWWKQIMCASRHAINLAQHWRQQKPQTQRRKTHKKW